jgi:hypothetical protein
LERVEDLLSTTREEKRTLEVNMGDAIAQMAQDRLRIQALEVNPPVLFAMKQRSEDDSPRDLLSSRLRPWSGSSVGDTGGKGSFTLWVHGGFMVGFE